VGQRRAKVAAAEVHEGRRLEQHQVLPGDRQLRGLAVELGFQAETRAASGCEGVNKPEPGVVPGSGMFGPGVAEADDQA